MARRIEANYLTPEVVAQRREIMRRLELKPGEHVLDIGAGPGLLTQEMATTVGPGGRVVGIDLSNPMLAMARARCVAQPWVELTEADAATLPFDKAAFDAAVAAQVYEYVGDLARAFSEARRVLRPGGRLLVLDTDWDAIVWNTTDRARTTRMLTAWREHLVHPHLPRTLARRLKEAGFAVEDVGVFTLVNTEYGEHTVSLGLTALMAAFVPGRHGITEAEVAAWAADLRALGAAGDYFFSLNRYLFLARNP
ncbi:MAG: methyltransferase type 11 [Candidatus Rokuibacteriota bacterium]|nr:MAG: methyltransferase type 11 [Candidatus Rokubacteria bacterium]